MKKEREVINLVVNTFGIYGGKVLEKITHREIHGLMRVKVT